jgi:hypothetical protein
MAAYAAPGAWDFRAHGHAAFAPDAAKHILDGRSEGSRAAHRRRLQPGDPELLLAMKRKGAQHALFIFRGASPAQREAMGASRRPRAAAAQPGLGPALTCVRCSARHGPQRLDRAALGCRVRLRGAGGCAADGTRRASARADGAFALTRSAQAGSDPQAQNSAGLTPLEYAAKEGQVACVEALAQAASLPSRPRATAALRAVAQALWRVVSPTATPLADFERHSASALLVCALRRLLQPHVRSVEELALGKLYFEGGRPLLARLAALDGDAPGDALCVRLDDAADEGTVASRSFLDAAKRAADAAAVAIALAGALTAPEQAAMASLRVRGFALPQRPQAAPGGSWPHAQSATLRMCTTVNALTECALVALGDALAAPAAPRHVTLELNQPFSRRFLGVSPLAEDAAASLPIAAAAAFSHALRAGWTQNGALRSLILELPPGMRLCPQQRLLLCTRALEAPHAAVTTVLLGACSSRSRSPLRLLSVELLRLVLKDCIFAVRIVERDAPDE